MTPMEVAGVVLYTLDEIAEQLKTTRVALRKYIGQGELRARKIGGNQWFVSEEALREFLQGEGPRKEEKK